MTCQVPGFQIIAYNDFGPIFGINDFFISNESNTNMKSYSNLGQSYTHPDYLNVSNESKSFWLVLQIFKYPKLKFIQNINKFFYKLKIKLV